MKPLIIANWKMNPVSQKEAENIFKGIRKGIKKVKSEVVVCPPFIYLSELNGITLGAQDVFFMDNGAFTGEISAEMLKNLGVEYVIIGHSERRRYFGETDEIIRKKISKASQFGLKVIFCCGETIEEKTAGKKEEILKRQITKGLSRINDNINIVYEPVWAIGTGNNCGVEEAKETINFIRKIAGGAVRVLYGGSVKSENSGEYIKSSGANGLLVGGASLDAEEFVKIVKSAE